MTGNRNFRKRIVFSAVIVAIIILILLYCKSRKNSPNLLKIAYSDSASAIIIKQIEKKTDIINNSLNSRFIDLGDCCGSYSQFAFANSLVDVALMCPDAADSLKASGKNYTVLGNLIYDSDVLLTKKQKKDIKTVGYMNNREEQKKLLTDIFGSTVSLVPMFPSGLVYALASDKIDAAFVDVTTYLNGDFEGFSVSDGFPTEVLVVRNEVLNNKLIKDFVGLYNDEVKNINTVNDYYVRKFIEFYDCNGSYEEILEKWNKIQPKFSEITKI